MAEVQGTLFEEGYLRRTLTSVAHVPDVGLTELVANAWDAGASKVEIRIPSKAGGVISVKDDGTGMTPEEFKGRWMKLAYDRLKHQGKDVEFPPKREGLRRAFGRNGVGRHGMLCFADEYTVRTKRDGVCGTFKVSTTRSGEPFVLVDESIEEVKGHGTTLSAVVLRNRPEPERIREILSSRFLYDPNFTVSVNGEALEIEQLSGFVDETIIVVADNVSVAVCCIDSSKSSRTKEQHGIAFWVGGRLVGQPSWHLGSELVLDGRTRTAKRYTIIVKSDDLHEEVLDDWTGFRKSELVSSLYTAVSEHVSELLKKILKETIEDTRRDVLVRNKEKLKELNPAARLEVAEFVQEMTESHPTLTDETISLAVGAVVKLEQSRSGKSLLEKLAALSPEDIEGLNHLLDEWTVKDALSVLEEVDSRLSVVEAIGKLEADESVDELHTLHPLVTQARWLFGPEYDSSLYASNLSIRRAVEQVFGEL